MTTSTVAAAPTTRPAPSRHSTRWVDEVEAARRAELADRIEAIRADLLTSIDYLVASTHTEPSHNKKRSRKQLVKAWIAMAKVAQDLSQPTPKFRPNVASQVDPEIEGVADFVPVALPTWVTGVAR